MSDNPKSRDKAYAQDILESAERLLQHANGMTRADLKSNLMFQDAVIKCLLVMG